jgi:hypothetical protein
VIAEVDGVVKYGDVQKQYRKIFVTGEDGETREYQIPRGAHINVQEGERVKAGEPLMDGPIDPHDILRVRGEKELQRYLVDEIQEVYRLQGVNINDKHIEVIVRQMMRWVKVEEIGDSEFLIDEVVDKFRFLRANDALVAVEKRLATGRPLLLGITKASLSTDSFISAASFQETTRVLTEAAISGKVDYLRGLKENVIMGRLIPAGTGMAYYRRIRIPDDVVERPELEGLDADYVPEYLVEPEYIKDQSEVQPKYPALGPLLGTVGTAPGMVRVRRSSDPRSRAPSRRARAAARGRRRGSGGPWAGSCGSGSGARRCPTGRRRARPCCPPRRAPGASRSRSRAGRGSGTRRGASG